MEVHKDKTPILLIDEAHMMESKRRDRDMLGQIQALTNWVHPITKQKLVQIILFGELPLIDLLKPHRALKRRVAQFGFLSPLTTDDAWDVLSHRWTVAGGQLPLPMDKDAFDMLYKSTKGLPSDLVKSANSAFMIAWGSRLDYVTVECAEYAVRENLLEDDKEDDVE